MSEIETQTKRASSEPRLRRWLRQMPQREDQAFLILTLVIGILVGLTVVAFIILTERLGGRMYPPGSAPWRRVLVPILGALGTGFLLYRYFPDARGSGVPQTKEALFTREGRITLGTVLGKFFCSSASLASGIALGREGPAVQVGAGIASVLGRLARLSKEKVKALVPVGAAAALAAAFNTPIAAVLFSLEEVMGNLHAPVLGSVVLGSATSWMVLRLLLGNEPLFHVPQYRVVHPLEFGIYAVLGVMGGLVSVAFVKTLLGLRGRFLRMPERSRWAQPVAGGLLVGLLGWFVPQVLGVGYGFVGDALNGRMALQLMAMLVLLKVVASATCYGSGNAGGIFGPSLFIGAMLGGAVGSVAHHFLPGHTAAPGAYALVGMGTAFAGIIRVPMTSVIMIFEVTHDYAIIVPLMISNLVSFFVSSRLQPTPIYEALALQDGIHLPTAETRGQEGLLRVSEAMRPRGEALSPNLTVVKALELTRRSGLHAGLVADEHGLLGLVSTVLLEREVATGAGGKSLGEFLERCTCPHVHADHSLAFALERMGTSGLDVLPVVSRANVREVEGIITLADILETLGVGRDRLAGIPRPPQERH